MFRIIRKTVYEVIRHRGGSFFIMITGMTAAMIGMLFVTGRARMIYLTEAFYNCETCSIKLDGSVEKQQLQELYKEVTENKKLPEIREMAAYDHSAGVIGMYGKDELRITIPYGRYFDSEEQKGGKVVLLSDFYTAQQDIAFLENMLGSSIDLPGAEEPYRVVGRYNGTYMQTNVSANEVIIPIETYMQETFVSEQIQIVFSDRLRSDDISEIKRIIKKYGQGIQITEPDRFEKAALQTAAMESMPQGAIFIAAYITIMNLFFCWIKTNMRRFYIYYLCGCSRKEIGVLMNVLTVVLLSAASAVSYALFQILESYFVPYRFLAELELKWSIFYYAGIWILTMSGVWIITAGQIRLFCEPKETGIV